MDGLVTLQGMVIRHSPVAEFDWVVTILTLERGKITAFAKGARRPGNRLAGAVEPFCFGHFKLYQGRTAYNLAEASIDQYFGELRQNLEAACYGSFFLEIADFYARENSDCGELLALLYQSLRALSNKALPMALVRCAYEIRAVAVFGEYAPPPDLEEGRGETYESARYAVNFIVSTPIRSLYTFTVTEPVLQILMRGTIFLRNRTIDRPLKSLAMLSAIEPTAGYAG